MRRPNLLLVAWLHQVLAPVCSARHPSFSIHDDLLAHPQFEVVFSDSFIREADALALLSSSPGTPTHATDFEPASETDLAATVRASGAADPARGDSDAGEAATADDDDNTPQVSETFEIINTPPTRYLCSVPVLAPPPPLNHTANELAKAEEARELTRASAKGWELMRGLEGECLYFMHGWWSYSFCYGKEIVQFHAVPSGVKGAPPVKDKNSHEYILGTTVAHHQSQPNHRQHETPNHNDRADHADQHVPAQAGDATGVAPPNTELQVKGDQRYLVQRLGDGTICDLTGRPRTIEIQYHCSPGSTMDRIGWIKEVTTCTYLMVVQTPRLCADVAFLPPKEIRAHPISCRPIVSNEEQASAWHRGKTLEAAESMGVAAGAQDTTKSQDPTGTSQNPFQGMTIGGVVVGGRQIIGSDEDGRPAAGLKLPKHLAAAAGKAGLAPLIGSKNDRIKVEVLTPEEIAKMDLDPETLEQLRKELQKMAGNWEIEVIDVDPEQDDVADHDGQDQQVPGQGQGRRDGKKISGAGAGAGAAQAGGRNTNRRKGNSDDDDDDEGSQEVFFKEEL
ncbi:glucosidase II beta subunit-like protein-domain-containing protein [Podospora appendiculata]|uniref:Endoplasmic reticulum lectin n=1 Tax=Podospora appendiculata TaxID=314037 RepID=A0AAE0WYC9_9PEZI|nr:glucosidase II beta subunit-like protein-domain-containing protein [Podospora appendiculata]